jgi:hypothetical protein
MDTISEQDRLMRERAAEGEVREQRRQAEQYKYNTQEAIFKGLVDAAKDPGIKGLSQKAETLRLAGMGQEAEAIDMKVAELIESSVDGFVQTQTGKPLDRNMFRSMVIAGGLDKALESSKEGGINRRFAAEQPIQEQQARTSAGNLALAREKEARETSGELPQAEYAKVVSTKIQKAMDNIGSLMTMIKDAQASGQPLNMDDIINPKAKALVGGAITPESLAKRLSNLSTLETEAMTGKLSKQKMDYIDKSLDLFKDIEMPLEPIAGARVGGTGGALPAQASRATLAPPAAPSPQAKVEQTAIGPVAIGEIRTSPKDGKQYRYLGNNQWTPAQ